eukprot:COSAG01_NODE_7251_length_3282_cov_6.586868_3_plen_76_part_00
MLLLADSDLPNSSITDAASSMLSSSVLGSCESLVPTRLTSVTTSLSTSSLIGSVDKRPGPNSRGGRKRSEILRKI